ncbi:MAG TPA: geranylgeranyl reductase family protein [Acidimicrobiales bacterium]|nr:geranylgeranyl reductase family protein [Acidimicrobiales bacterium]
MEHIYDAAVIGAGPAGASCAYWLAKAGCDVVFVDKKQFPREKTCGDGLTPRAVRQLWDMGLSEQLDNHHYYKGLRAYGFGHFLQMEWPDHPDLPSAGYTVTRYDLDDMVSTNAQKAGALLMQGTEALGVLREAGHSQGAVTGIRVRGADSDEIRARYIVVADGANSRIGRELGVHRHKTWPQGMAIRGYWDSVRHDEPWIESHLDITGEDGEVLPGYGWVFPLGDGRVNLGVGLLNTSISHKGNRAANTTKLLDSFLRKVGANWDVDVDNPCAPPTGGRLPMGLAVGPRSGPNYLMAGDSAGTINPFNGEGISYAYETGRMAAGCIIAALGGGGATSLSRYDQLVEEEYGDYYRLGRAFVRIIGHPAVLRACVGTGMRSKPIMEIVMRVMANILRPGYTGVAETAVEAAYLLEHLKDRLAI